MLLTQDDLEKFCPASTWFGEGLQEACDSNAINTPIRLQYFLAQVAKESAGFTHMEENLNYSAQRLLAVWPNHFPTLDVAQQYAGNPEKLANLVYANRMGNGDEASGDGWAFHGRGLIQITGRNNYSAIDSAMGYNGALILNPNKLLDKQAAADSAGAFFGINNLNRFADVHDFTGLTQAINGGLLGIQDRLSWLEKASIIWPV